MSFLNSKIMTKKIVDAMNDGRGRKSVDVGRPFDTPARLPKIQIKDLKAMKKFSIDN